jgi:hypothetical protein
MENGHAGPGLPERMVRNARIAGLAGVALSGLITLLPIVAAASSTQWVCAGAGALVGAALAFVPDRSRPARR